VPGKIMARIRNIRRTQSRAFRTRSSLETL
jgi:hypothetical protein